MEVTFENLLKAHVRLMAAQRNLNALVINIKDSQQKIQIMTDEFRAIKNTVQDSTGKIYNEETLELEK